MLFLRKQQSPPPMTLEGVLGPNLRLDEAAGMRVELPRALCVTPRGTLLFSSGNAVLSLSKWGADASGWAIFEAPVTALCASPGGLVAVGLAGGRLAILDAAARPVDAWTPGASAVRSVEDCLFRTEDEIIVVDNGYGADQDALSIAPWDSEARGQVLSLSPSGATQVLAGGLHCPMGICRDRSGELLVTLLERASIVDMDGKVRHAGYPGYLGRIRKSKSGYVLSCLARRDPLIEFLKTEEEFVAAMKASMDPAHWISPRVSPEFSHEFPIELGATRLFGEIKPWAPSFSYGLVIELDESLTPVRSAHSRANGTRHAISDASWWNEELIAVSRGSGELLNLGSGSGPA